MKQLFILVSVEQTHSRMNAVPLYRIHWLDPLTGKTYETTTDSSYRNHPHWAEVIQNRQTGYYTGLRKTQRTTRDGTQVISADSRPRLQHSLSSNEVREILQDLLSPAKTTFNQLFTQE